MTDLHTRAEAIAAGMRKAISRYFAALDKMQDYSERGQDDSGKRDTPSYPQWLIADCEYTEAMAELRELGETP